MKQKKTIFILLGLLALSAGITYLIIRLKAKKEAEAETLPGDGDSSGSSSKTTSTVTAGNGSGSGYSLPKIQSYTWWENKLGRAGFPLRYGSKGVEVVKLQEELNALSASKDMANISVDGVWGPETDTRLKSLFPNTSEIPQSMFSLYFDKMNEIIKR